MFGSQILVAPLKETGDSRSVYLPEGKWIDYQTGEVYAGGYRRIKTDKIPCVILVRDGSYIPQVPVAQSTDRIEWDKLEWKAYQVDEPVCRGLLFRPGDADVQTVQKQ